ncbi:MAG: hypothetical protein JRF02_05845 [Deltaproteobacteria bacterium]|jgi:hypothetical protein|nr:hypothetical protein [Deltaproteobacteria bacterium]
MLSFKDEWNLEMALDVLKNKSVDSKVWSDAAKWIMLYGPPELQEVMREASEIATKSCFPELEPERYTENGEPCYNIEKIAEALGMTREEAMERIAEIQEEHGIKHLFDASETENIH